MIRSDALNCSFGLDFPGTVWVLCPNSNVLIESKFIDERTLHNFQLNIQAHAPLTSVVGHHVMQEAFKINLKENLAEDLALQDL